jgi:hemerythrin-like domain-containing protein
MRITKSLRADQDNIKRLITALSGASIEVRSNKRAKPKFFITAHEFIVEYVDEGFFKKEEILIKVLEDGGFPLDKGPIGSILADQQKSHEVRETLLKATKQWEAGDEGIRIEVGWASSEYASTLRQHLERFKSLIFPLLEQTISIDDEDKISDSINSIVFEGKLKDGTEKYAKMLDELEEELSDWK